jgi:hypothetical protein
MTPAVPDPTVEALSEAIWDAMDAKHDHAYHVHAAECCWPFKGSMDAIRETLAARAAAPDALRVAVEALLASIDKEREFWLAEAEQRHDTFTFVQRDVADYRATRDPQVAKLRALLEDGDPGLHSAQRPAPQETP